MEKYIGSKSKITRTCFQENQVIDIRITVRRTFSSIYRKEAMPGPSKVQHLRFFEAVLFFYEKGRLFSKEVALIFSKRLEIPPLFFTRVII